MKTVLVSQRVDPVPGRDERRDALDQRLVVFLLHCDLVAVPVPNDIAAARALVDSVPWCGVVLSGGNDLHALGGDAPERDAVESCLVDAAESAGRPVVGICRGLQFLVHRDGGTLARRDGHVATRHPLDLSARPSVNSYHRWAVLSLPDGWRALASAPDATIEWACQSRRNLWGMMWHPERDEAVDARDAGFFREIFGTGGQS